jgi:hypothetical protein
LVILSLMLKKWSKIKLLPKKHFVLQYRHSLTYSSSMQALQALEEKSTFLSEPDWKVLPFSISGKGTFDHLLDLLLEVPVILHDLTKMLSLPPKDQLRPAVDLLNSCIILDGELQLFSHMVESLSRNPLYWEVPSASGSELYPICYSFTDSQAATTMGLYWGTMAMGWSGMCHLYRHVTDLTTLKPTSDGFLTGRFSSEDGSAENFLLPIPTRCKDFATVARNVCKSVEYCFQNENALPGMVAPLHMVLDVLNGWPGFEQEVKWIIDTLATMKKRGMKIMQYLHGPPNSADRKRPLVMQ